MIRSLWIILALVWVWLLAIGVGALPALGPLLDFRRGVWRSHGTTLESGILRGLQAPVQVSIDASGVPHIFAANEPDLYRAQGYVMASHRLFQMDLSSRVVAGELSELAGARTLATDRFFVSFGMRESVRRDLKRYMDDPKTKMMLNSFTQGVNEFIDRSSTWPPEYLVLGVKPKRFEPIHVLFMAKLLTYNLAARSHDLLLSQIQQRLGTQKVLDLFPEFHPKELEDYIFPQTAAHPVLRETPEMFPFVSQLKGIPKFPLANPGNGSNNWAVSPRKSTTGYSILANDTHLSLSLPNVWYENQLSAPGLNVYGVSLNAVPGIVLGFNSEVAWATTNGTTDVLDFFEVEFESQTSQSYMRAGQWMDADVVEETIRVKNGRDQKLPVVRTHFGYLIYREGKLGLAADWLPHKTNGIELQALRGLFSTKTYSECLASLKAWKAPIQNFICADKHNISLEHIGSIPKRRVGQGRFIMNGRENGDVLAWGVPELKNPRTVNPDSGYVLSANQKVLGPRSSWYLGWDYEQAFRGHGIRRRLDAKERLSPEDFIEIQNDCEDMEARLLLPLMLASMPVSSGFGPDQLAALKGLKAWGFKMKSEDWEPTLFKEWFHQFRRELFTDDFGDSIPIFPNSARIATLLENLRKHPGGAEAHWVDDQSTPQRESAAQILVRAWALAWTSLARDLGSDFKRWHWKLRMRPELRHIARIPGFGARVGQMDGASTSVRGISTDHGPVYKLVVAFGQDHPEAWIQIPGHNQGNPFAREFEQHVEGWARGEMRKVEFYKDKEQAKLKAVNGFELHPERKD